MKAYYELLLLFWETLQWNMCHFLCLKTSKTSLTPIPKSSSIKLFMVCLYFSRKQTLRHDERILPKKCPKIQLTRSHICGKMNLNTLTLLSRYPKWVSFYVWKFEIQILSKKNGWESNWQFNSKSLKHLTKGLTCLQLECAIWHWKALFKMM